MKYWNSIFYLIFAGLFFMAGCSKDKPQTKADFTASSDSANVFDTVYFTNKSQNANNYVWYFGDGNSSISVEQNPSHVYTTKGSYTVSLKAIGSGNSDSTSQTIIILPYKGSVITEGQGIPEIKIGDTWADVKTTLPPTTTDTAYASYFYADQNLYANWVYYDSRGIGVGFVSKTATLDKADPAFIVTVYMPNYIGTTTKGITLGTGTLTKVKAIYGNPESTDTSDPSFTGYSYSSQGIDFYTYNPNSPEIVNQMFVYSASGSGRISVINPGGSDQLHRIYEPVLPKGHKK